ncbi:cuticle protein 63-like [Coccinella septempunctata]|uniref:cuticle protein 63-like n=1 Tax=Coccinella septempunctata TaxID=41139 RepID=UPI001D07B0E0|nr:cuticle protein 63-like [Coccinella septempunctata]
MKFLVCVCAVLAVAAAGESKKDKRGIYGESLGYGYGGYGLGGLDHGLAYSAPLSLGPSLSYGYSSPIISKSYVSAPIITKSVLPAPIVKTVVAPAPILKTVVAPSPIYKTYAAAPLYKSYSAPIYRSYAAAPVIKSYSAPISIGHGYGYGLGDLSLGHGLSYSSGLELGHGW